MLVAVYFSPWCRWCSTVCM